MGTQLLPATIHVGSLDLTLLNTVDDVCVRHIYIFTGNAHPILRDLYDQVVPSVAHKWRDLGVYLLEPSLIDQQVLQVIAADHPHSVEDCC